MTKAMGRAYFHARGVRARELAQTATNPEIAQIHDRMAKSYFELAELTPNTLELHSLPGDELGQPK